VDNNVVGAREDAATVDVKVLREQAKTTQPPVPMRRWR